MRKVILIHSVAFIALAFFLILIKLNILSMTESSLLIKAAMVHGLLGVYLSINENSKIFVVLFTGIFITGIVFYTLENFRFFAPQNIVAPSFFIWLGISGIMLFIQNPKNISFLFSGILLTTTSILLLTVLKKSAFLIIINSYLLLIFDFWFLFVFTFGLVILGRKKE